MSIAQEASTNIPPGKLRRPAALEDRKARTSVIQRLARQAERLQLGDHLLLGRGEEKTGGRRKMALLADGYEALIAAIYLDGGIDPARAFIVREFAPDRVILFGSHARRHAGRP